MGQVSVAVAISAALALAGSCASSQADPSDSPSSSAEPTSVLSVEAGPAVDAAIETTPSTGSVAAVPDHLVQETAAPVSSPSTVAPMVEAVNAVAPVAPTPTGPAEGGGPSSDGVAGAFLSDVNALRAAEGRSALVRDAGLDAFAQSWAATMAADGSLHHSTLISDVVASGWSAAGENIAFGPDEASVFAGLRASPGHRANMVSADYSHVGIGVVVVGPVVWTDHLFAG